MKRGMDDMKKWIAIPALAGLLVLGGVGMVANADKSGAQSENLLLVEEIEQDFGGAIDRQVKELAYEQSDNEYEERISNGVVKTAHHAVSPENYISEKQAIAIAMELAQGTVTEVELDTDDGRVYYEIEIQDHANEYEFEIDAITGEVIEYEKDSTRDRVQ